jgi:hypothetical protein
MRLLPLCFVLACAAAPALADPLTGLEDAHYKALITRALAGETDPSISAEMHELAEAGNMAATVALPTILLWSPPQGSLRERNRFRKINDVALPDLVAQTDPAAALWDNGNVGDPAQLPERARALAELGEEAKAGSLMTSWVNFTGGLGPLPEGLFEGATPAWVLSVTLSSRIGWSQEKGDPDLFRDLLRQDHLAAWMALAEMQRRGDPGLKRLGDPLAGTGIDSNHATDRLRDAAAVLSVSPLAATGSQRHPDQIAQARKILQTLPEFAPVHGLCATCPDSIEACETAFLTYPGLPVGGFEALQPFHSAVPADQFYASARAIPLLLSVVRGRAGQDPNRAAAIALDSCYAQKLEIAESAAR